MTWTVLAFYAFTPLADPPAQKARLTAVLGDLGACGTVLLAPEGVNGTLALPADRAATAETLLRALPGCAAMEIKRSAAAARPFRRLKVRLKREIVTLGAPEADPARGVGTYVAPADWNALIAAPEVAVIDTRNAYEVRLGSFRGAIDPGTARFRDFPAWWDAQAGRLAGRPVAMFCTGGIRCEKATSLLKARGLGEVFHLQGGILKYLETVPAVESLWHGSCFVFDRRVALGHGLAPAPAHLCHGCRRPLLPQDLEKVEYEEGVSCHLCWREHSAADRARFRQRHRQMQRAAGAAARAGAPLATASAAHAE
ncbi:MAG: rhodanese-related sulfurtransferase [Pseudomonadota bacterium]